MTSVIGFDAFVEDNATKAGLAMYITIEEAAKLDASATVLFQSHDWSGLLAQLRKMLAVQRRLASPNDLEEIDLLAARLTRTLRGLSPSDTNTTARISVELDELIAEKRFAQGVVETAATISHAIFPLEVFETNG